MTAPPPINTEEKVSNEGDDDPQADIISVIPMRPILEELLRIPGLLGKIIEYSRSADASTFTGSTAWKEQISKQPVGSLCFPIDFYFDSFDVHHQPGYCKMGCLYVVMPFLPPDPFFDSSFLVGIFRCKEEFNNGQIFKSVIEELNDLREKGITLPLGNGRFRINVKFGLGCLIGEDSVLNNLMGFTNNADALRCCRFCRATRHQFPLLKREDPSLLRTAANYQEDYQQYEEGSSDAGIVKENVWRNVNHFSIDNSCGVDIKHSIFGKVAPLTMELILKGLINRNNCFDIAYLNSRIASLDYEPDKESKPSQIDVTETGFNFRMTASEMRTFLAYFGVMVGDKVEWDLDNDELDEDEDDQNDESGPEPPKRRQIDESTRFFHLYNLLSSIIIRISTNTLSWTHGFLIEKIGVFLSKYIAMARLAGHGELNDDGSFKLPPDFHIMTHYPTMMLRHGLLNERSSMNLESKLQMVKSALTNNPHFKIAKEIQDQMNRLLFENTVPNRSHIPGPLRNVTDDDERSSESSLRDFRRIPDDVEICIADFVLTSRNIRLSRKQAVCIGTQERLLPRFVQITRFLCDIENQKIYFEGKDFETLCFDNHFHAYLVTKEYTKSYHLLEDVIRWCSPLPYVVSKDVDSLAEFEKYIILKYMSD